MSKSRGRAHAEPRKARGKGPHHVIVARGDRIRSYQVRPSRWIALGLTIVLLSGSLLGATGYLMVRDDTIEEAQADQNEMSAQYERRIADLNRTMDALVSRHLVEQQTTQSLMADLVDRQEALVMRQELLTGLARDAISVGIDVLPMSAPPPLTNPLRSDPAAEGEDHAALYPPRQAVDMTTAAAMLEESMTRIEADQINAVAMLATAVNERTALLTDALEPLGFEIDEDGRDIGGPLVVAALGPEGFHDDITDIRAGLAVLTDIHDYARDLPLAKPIPEITVTSRFGRRMDPFLGSMAMHTGVDLRAASGVVVRATAPGVVISAGYNGGYGNMVDVDHGNGLVTRYGHMSSIAVDEGDYIAAGTVVGRVGSTGRSTGPHLHYEIRRNDVAIDPMPYVTAGAELAEIL